MYILFMPRVDIDGVHTMLHPYTDGLMSIDHDPDIIMVCTKSNLIPDEYPAMTAPEAGRYIRTGHPEPGSSRSGKINPARVLKARIPGVEKSGHRRSSQKMAGEKEEKHRQYGSRKALFRHTIILKYSGRSPTCRTAVETARYPQSAVYLSHESNTKYRSHKFRAAGREGSHECFLPGRLRDFRYL